MKPIDRRKPNELSGKIRLKKKKAQGDAPDILHEVSLIGLAANLDDPRYHRAIGKLFYYFGGAQVDKRHTYTATSRQPSFASLH